MYDLLFSAFGPQRWWPAPTAFEVVVGAYLTQNTSWKAVERSLANLRAAGTLNIEGLRAISVDQLRDLIRPSGFYTRKAPALKAFVDLLDREFSGSLDVMASLSTEKLRKRLLSLPGVGPETADAILLYALKHPVPVADDYLRRLVERHNLAQASLTRDQSGYDSLVQLTRTAFAADDKKDLQLLYGEFHALTVELGKEHCKQVALCEGCPLEPDLAYMRKAKPSIKRSFKAQGTKTRGTKVPSQSGSSALPGRGDTGTEHQ